MASDELKRTLLQPDEQLAFAGLARLLIRADGTFSAEESQALEEVAAELFGPLAEGPELMWEMLDRAGRELPDDQAVKKAAQAVVRPAAREAIYGALFEIASSDTIAREEWPLLDWLATEWAVESEKEE